MFWFLLVLNSESAIGVAWKAVRTGCLLARDVSRLCWVVSRFALWLNVELSSGLVGSHQLRSGREVMAWCEITMRLIAFLTFESRIFVSIDVQLITMDTM